MTATLDPNFDNINVSLAMANGSVVEIYDWKEITGS